MESTLKETGTPSLKPVMRERQDPFSDDAMSQGEFAQWGTAENFQ